MGNDDAVLFKQWPSSVERDKCHVAETLSLEVNFTISVKAAQVPEAPQKCHICWVFDGRNLRQATRLNFPTSSSSAAAQSSTIPTHNLPSSASSFRSLMASAQCLLGLTHATRSGRLKLKDKTPIHFFSSQWQFQTVPRAVRGLLNLWQFLCQTGPTQQFGHLL